MHDPVAILKQDHRDVAAMLKTLDASRLGARRTATVTKLTKALTLHMQIEEKIIYPQVSKLVGKDDAKEATIEHGLVREALTELQKLVAKPGFGAAVAMITAGIKHHVKEEETKVFPALKKKLGRDELSALGDEVVAAKKAGRRSS